MDSNNQSNIDIDYTLEGHPVALIGFQDGGNGFSCLDRDCAFLNNDLVALGYFSDVSCCRFNILQIRGTTFSQTIHLCGSVDRNEDQICFFDGLVNICGEAQILSTHLKMYTEIFIQTLF